MARRFIFITGDIDGDDTPGVSRAQPLQLFHEAVQPRASHDRGGSAGRRADGRSHRLATHGKNRRLHQRQSRPLRRRAEGVPRDSQRQRAAAACRGCPPLRGVDGHGDAAHRSSEMSASKTRKGHPIVYGEWLGAPGKPTILFYGHYDVQPVDPVDQWTSPPFEATIRDGEIYARGSADDKGQVFMHFKAVEALHPRARRTAGEHEVPDRGRRGSRQRQPRRLHSGSQRSAEGRCGRDQRLADVRSRHPVDLLRPPGPHLFPDRSARDQNGSALGVVRRRRRATRRWCWRKCWRR